MKTRFKKGAKIVDIMITAVSGTVSVAVMLYGIFHFGLSETWPKVTAVNKTSGIDIIEAVERTDKPFFLGLQYHPEVAVAKHADHAADALRFMDYDDALSCFRALVEQGKKR